MAFVVSPTPRTVVLLTIIAFLLFGLWALDLHVRQTRDVKRALDLEDIETALWRLVATTGALPPAAEPTWCGTVSAAENTVVRSPIEEALRETKKYANPKKPFPADPRFRGTSRDYLYVKTSPVSFELLSELEADNNNSKAFDLSRCSVARTGSTPGARGAAYAGGYDYAISSLARRPL